MTRAITNAIGIPAEEEAVNTGREQVAGLSYLKSGIETRNAAFNQMVERIERVAIASPAPILLLPFLLSSHPKVVVVQWVVIKMIIPEREGDWQWRFSTR